MDNTEQLKKQIKGIIFNACLEGKECPPYKLDGDVNEILQAFKDAGWKER